MKKLLLLFVCLFTLQTIARADDDKPIQVSQMPQKAQQFIKQHFAGSNIAMAKVESDFLQKSYDVIFTDGNKVEFDKKGNWTEVNCKFSVVPQGSLVYSERSMANDRDRPPLSGSAGSCEECIRKQ